MHLLQGSLLRPSPILPPRKVASIYGLLSVLECGEENRIMDVICGTSKQAVRIAQELSKVPDFEVPQMRPRCVLNLRALQGRAEAEADGSATAESYADLVRRMRVEVGMS